LPYLLLLCSNHLFYFLLQVYNEQIKDLITKDPIPKDIKVLQDPKLGVVIKGIREQVVRNPQEVRKLLTFLLLLLLLLLSQILGEWEAEGRSLKGLKTTYESL
jgi:hypothetical protein